MGFGTRRFHWVSGDSSARCGNRSLRFDKVIQNQTRSSFEGHKQGYKNGDSHIKQYNSKIYSSKLSSGKH